MKIAVLIACFLFPALVSAESVPQCEARCAMEFVHCRTSDACSDDMDMNCKCGDRENACKQKCAAESQADRPTRHAGGLAPDTVVQTIRSRKAAVIACYERGLKRNPNLNGRVVVHFVINAVGKVLRAEVENDTLGDQEVSDCVTATVLSWRFPASDGGDTQFSFPFTFSATKR